MDRTEATIRFIADNVALRKQLADNVALHQKLLLTKARLDEARRSSAAANIDNE